MWHQHYCVMSHNSKGWHEPGTNHLWHIPLVQVVCNNNVDTLLVKRPPREYLPQCPPLSEAIHNVYEWKTQPKLMRYHHAAVRFPTKPTWHKAVKKRQFTSWHGLTASVESEYFPKLKETIKWHACKMPSRLQSTKKLQLNETVHDKEKDAKELPTFKHCDIFTQVYPIDDEEGLCHS